MRVKGEEGTTGMGRNERMARERVERKATERVQSSTTLRGDFFNVRCWNGEMNKMCIG